MRTSSSWPASSSKSRSPSPSSSGATWICISSSSPAAQVLLDGARAAGDDDVLVAGRGARLLERGLDAVGDEVERRPALLERLARVVGEHEDGVWNGGSSPHQPFAFGSSSHGPAPPLNICRPMIVGAGARDLSSMTSSRRSPRRRSRPCASRHACGVERPLVQLLAALAERILERLVGPATKPSSDIVISSVSASPSPRSSSFACSSYTTVTMTRNSSVAGP